MVLESNSGKGPLRNHYWGWSEGITSWGGGTPIFSQSQTGATRLDLHPAKSLSE